MGSRLNVILKRDGVLSVSYSRIRANDLPVFLAFGPLAAWESLSQHQDSVALFKASDLNQEWIDNDFESVHQMFNLGDEGSVIVDWDDKVLWYFTDFDFEKYGYEFWGSWFASWIDVFWQDWTILRPYTLSFRDISAKLGFETELDYTQTWNYSRKTNRRIFYSSYNPIVVIANVLREIKNRIFHIADTLKYGPTPYNREKSFVAVIQNRSLKFYRVAVIAGADGLINGGPSIIPKHIPSYKLDFADYISFTGQNSIAGLVDLDKKQAFFTPGFRGQDANPFTAWSGWNARSDRQGLCSWIANTDIDWEMHANELEKQIDAYFDLILTNCTEVGPINDSISRSLREFSVFPIQDEAFAENPFPRGTPDASGSTVFSGEEDFTKLESWIALQTKNQNIRAENYRQFYKRMKMIYLSDTRLKQRIFIDRHHTKNNWEPDKKVYSRLNQINLRANSDHKR